MIEVVTLDDLSALLRIKDDGSDGKKQATLIIANIIKRMPRPRAYVCEPTLNVQNPRSVLWTMVYDILTRALVVEDHVSVIEPETLRFLLSRTAPLSHLCTRVDPMLQTLAAFRLVDVVYLPDDGHDKEHFSALKKRAKEQNVTVKEYRPKFEPVAKTLVSPPKK